MKLLLQEAVEKLGNIGDIVDVPTGYGRNYLIPKGIALPLTKDNLQRLESRKTKLIADAEKKIESLGTLAKKIETTEVHISMQAGDDGKLFGSVTPQIITEAFKNEGLELEAKWFLLEEPLKELGVYNVRVRLHPEVITEAKVWVVEQRGIDDLEGKGDEPGEPAPE